MPKEDSQNNNSAPVMPAEAVGQGTATPTNSKQASKPDHKLSGEDEMKPDQRINMNRKSERSIWMKTANLDNKIKANRQQMLAQINKSTARTRPYPIIIIIIILPSVGIFPRKFKH